MTNRTRHVLLPFVAVLAILLLIAAGAAADIGIETVSRRSGSPGDEVTVRIGCGCFPPCRGPRAEPDRSGPCDPGSKGGPPAGIPIALLPIADLRARLGCRSRSFCTAVPAPGLPRDAPFVPIGSARPVPAPAAGHPVPRYRLRFRVPPLKPGTYAYVLFNPGPGGSAGSLVTFPQSPAWRLRVEPSASN
jgi:hypothetical protein